MCLGVVLGQPYLDKTTLNLGVIEAATVVETVVLVFVAVLFPKGTMSGGFVAEIEAKRAVFLT
jgi:hypothetical protein